MYAPQQLVLQARLCHCEVDDGDLDANLEGNVQAHGKRVNSSFTPH